MANGFLIHPLRPSARRRRAFTMLELAIALFVFGMIVLLFGATFPVATRAGHVGSDYAQASLLAQHKIDQLRQARTTGLSAANLASVGIIDSATANADGSYSFTLVDHLIDNGGGNGFFPTGSTGRLWLNNPTTAPAKTSSGGNWSPPSNQNAVYVVVTIQWQGGSQSGGSFTTHAIISLS